MNREILLDAGQIIGLIAKHSEQEWIAASNTPGLEARYRRHIQALLSLRHTILPKQVEEATDDRS